MAAMLRTFFDFNRRFSNRVERRLPQAREELFETYETTVARYMTARPGQLVVDVGGGRACPFAKYRRPGDGTRIVAVDISAEELALNRDVDETRVANIMHDLPFADGEADMVVSRAVVEHLRDVEAFIATGTRVLKPGGFFIHVFSARYAPFAVLNRFLPDWFSQRVLYFFHPTHAGIGGFPAFYDRCYPSAFTNLLDKHGFELEECRITFYQSRYYNFFFPLYLASVAYELAARAAGLRDLCAYVLIVARKR